MTPYILAKLLLVFLLIPLVYGLVWVTKRNLRPSNPMREFLERNGVGKIAQYTLVAVYALGGIWLTLMYS
jgi:hypothetical protein